MDNNIDFQNNWDMNGNIKFENVRPKNLGLIKFGMFLLFILTIASIWLSLAAFGYVTNYHHRFFTFIKDAWVLWCFLPIPIASIILGIKFHGYGLSCKKNIIAGLIVAAILFIYGSFCLISFGDEDYKSIYKYSKYMGVNVPDEGTLQINEFNGELDGGIRDCVYVNAYFETIDDTVIDSFENDIQSNSNWMSYDDFQTDLKAYVPVIMFFTDDTYYSFYNETTGEYNKLPDKSGEYIIYSMSYNMETDALYICKYTYDYNK